MSPRTKSKKTKRGSKKVNSLSKSMRNSSKAKLKKRAQKENIYVPKDATKAELAQRLAKDPKAQKLAAAGVSAVAIVGGVGTWAYMNKKKKKEDDVASPDAKAVAPSSLSASAIAAQEKAEKAEKEAKAAEKAQEEAAKEAKAQEEAEKKAKAAHDDFVEKLKTWVGKNVDCKDGKKYYISDVDKNKSIEKTKVYYHAYNDKDELSKKKSNMPIQEFLKMVTICDESKDQPKRHKK